MSRKPSEEATNNLPPGLASALNDRNRARGINSQFQQPSSLQTNINDSQGRSMSSSSINRGANQSSNMSQPQPMGQFSQAELEPSANIQQKLFHMSQTIQRQAGLPSNVQAILTGNLRDLCQTFNEREMQIQNDVKAIAREREMMHTSLQDNTRLLNSALAERDRAYRERDEFTTQLERARLARSSMERLRQVEKNLTEANSELRAQIKLQQDQISGKKSLWLDNHPLSGSRLNNTPDPFVTPSRASSSQRPPSQAASTGRSLHGKVDTLKLVNEQPEAVGISPQSNNSSSPLATARQQPYSYGSTTSRSTHTRPNSLASNAVTPDASNSQSTWRNSAGKGKDRQLPVGPSSPSDSTALVPFRSEDQVSAEFAGGIEEMWQLLMGWTGTFTSSLNSEATDQKVESITDLWKFLLTLTYPNPRDSHDHVILLLRNSQTRMFLVMRLIVSYITRNMWTTRAWEGFDEISSTKLRSSIHCLESRGMSSESRAAALADISSTIASIQSASDYGHWRSDRLGTHTKQLRVMLGPLLNEGAVRAEAGRGIGEYAVHAWDLGARMLTSGWQFKFAYPDCGTKFASSSMIAHPDGNEDAKNRQTKVKLAITPVITAREDRAGRIRARQIASANVLVMD